MTLVRKLHGRLGDFWWYSLMLFIACRAADFLNVFVGLWLVPKYVPPAELGAVMPLAQFANCLALPVAVFAGVFRNEMSTLALGGEFGKLKTLMRGVFIASGIFLVLAIVISQLALPHFLDRIRIVEGSLGTLILLASFIGTVAPIYNNTLQVLKKFKATSLINIVGAPIRLTVMLLAMPLRPLAGYFVGQISTPLFTIAASVFSLRKELAVKAEPYWTSSVFRRFGILLFVLAANGIAGNLSGLAEMTIIRQRLPETDSAGFYMITRFSDIATYLYATLAFTIFPFTAELAAKGKNIRPLILKASGAILATNALLAAVFALVGRPLLELLPHGNTYAGYWWAIPWQIGINTMAAIVGIFSTAEISANRFGFIKWMVPLNLLNGAMLILITGYGHFAQLLPGSWSTFLDAHNIRTLQNILWWFTGIGILRLVGMGLALCRGTEPAHQD